MISISRLMSREGVMRSSKLGRADPSAEPEKWKPAFGEETVIHAKAKQAGDAQPRLAKSLESVLRSEAQWPESSALRLASNMNQTRRSA